MILSPEKKYLAESDKYKDLKIASPVLCKA